MSNPLPRGSGGPLWIWSQPVTRLSDLVYLEQVRSMQQAVLETHLAPLRAALALPHPTEVTDREQETMTNLNKQELLKLNVIPQIDATDPKVFAAKHILAYYQDLVACRRNVLGGPRALRRLFVDEFGSDTVIDERGRRVAGLELTAHSQRLRNMTQACRACSSCAMKVGRGTSANHYQHCRIAAVYSSYIYNDAPERFSKLLATAVRAATKHLGSANLHTTSIANPS